MKGWAEGWPESTNPYNCTSVRPEFCHTCMVRMYGSLHAAGNWVTHLHLVLTGEAQASHKDNLDPTKCAILLCENKGEDPIWEPFPLAGTLQDHSHISLITFLPERTDYFAGHIRPAKKWVHTALAQGPLPPCSSTLPWIGSSFQVWRAAAACPQSGGLVPSLSQLPRARSLATPNKQGHLCREENQGDLEGSSIRHPANPSSLVLTTLYLDLY